MQGMLVILERDGFIVGTLHPKHGRIIMTERTSNGRKVAQAGATAADTVERQTLAGMMAQEMRSLHDLLQRCATALEAS